MPTYLEIRDQIKTGDAFFSHHTGLGGKIIQYFTKSEYTHTGIIWRANKRLFLIEAVIPKVRMVLLSNQGDFTLVQTGVTPSEQVLDTFFRELDSGIYSRWECIIGYFGFNKEDSRWQCSELVKYFYRLCGRQLFGKATPATVHDELVGRGGKSIFVRNS